MPHVINDNCQDCRYTQCVGACPVDCFHGSAQRLYIDPEACIDCAACVPLCPVRAIADSFDCGDAAEALVQLNRHWSQELPVVDQPAAALPTAEARRRALGFGAG